LQVENKQEVASGSEAEVELRAASIVAVELLKDAANEQLRQRQGQQQQQQQQEGGSALPEQQAAADSPRLLSIQVGFCIITAFVYALDRTDTLLTKCSLTLDEGCCSSRIG
jgi:hypothetical protein